MDFESFKNKLKGADDDALIASLIEHAKKMDEDINYYDAVKLIKAELLQRMTTSVVIDVRECLNVVEELESDGIEFAEFTVESDGIKVHSVADDFNERVEYDAISIRGQK